MNPPTITRPAPLTLRRSDTGEEITLPDALRRCPEVLTALESEAPHLRMGVWIGAKSALGLGLDSVEARLLAYFKPEEIAAPFDASDARTLYAALSTEGADLPIEAHALALAALRCDLGIDDAGDGHALIERIAADPESPYQRVALEFLEEVSAP